jgi:hypothetical protein
VRVTKDIQVSVLVDRCRRVDLRNVTHGHHQYAIQPTWSDEAFDAGKDGCAV